MIESAPSPKPPRPRVIIVGGGFGGLAAARQLRRADAQVILIDQRNHHLFQPLLYQVATAALSPANIAVPIRKLFRRQKNVQVILGRVTAVDPHTRVVVVDEERLTYDYLVLATGATHSYFGHEEWERSAPGLKSIEDALEIRRRFLLAFERAERERDEARRSAELTFVVVGGGPTGVELAGAMAEIARDTMPEDFRNIDTSTARVILLEGLDRLLAAFPEKLSRRAERDLRALGVDVRLGCLVTDVTPDGVEVQNTKTNERFTLDAKNVVWAAGVKASPLGQTVTTRLDRAGRVEVQPDLSVPGHPEIFAIGDLAAAKSDGKPVPGVAQGALQGGAFVGRVIARELSARRRGAPVPDRPTFHYRDKGSMATLGRNRAIAEVWGLALGGFVAWVLWAFVHIAFLIGFRNKVLTMLEWAWMYVFHSRGSRLITETAKGKD